VPKVHPCPDDSRWTRDMLAAPIFEVSSYLVAAP
jgi:hypothetical protein